MRISFFSVKGLYGDFDYEFNIKSGQHIFLLTGPNGYGKTTILNIIKELSVKNLYFFYSLPFREICLGFEEDNKIFIYSKDLPDEMDMSTSDVEILKERKLTFEWIQKDNLVESLVIDNSVIQQVKRDYRFQFRYDNLRLSEKNKQILISRLLEKQKSSQIFLFLSGMSVSMLPSNRLSDTKYDERQQVDVPLLTIEDVSGKLKNLLEGYYLSYLKKVNSSNSGIFDKLLKDQPPMSEEEYEIEVKSLSSKLVQLHEWGLSSEKNVRPYSNDHKDVMTVYIQELKNNLTVYQDLYDKLLLFKELLENKKFVNKTISFGPADGLTARNRSGVKIDLKNLSSGEQHEIIMLYYSIFGVSRSSLLLVDEPENSLHVAWQLKYYQEMETIANKLGVQIIIATHSPQIIGERWDECYDLYEAVNDGQLD